MEGCRWLKVGGEYFGCSGKWVGDTPRFLCAWGAGFQGADQGFPGFPADEALVPGWRGQTKRTGAACYGRNRLARPRSFPDGDFGGRMELTSVSQAVNVACRTSIPNASNA